MHSQLQSIKEASEGLLFMSESDHPFEVIHFELANNTIEQHIQALAKKDNPIEQQSLDYFFRNAIKVYPEADETQKQMAQRYQSLQSLLQTSLKDVLVYRIGTVNIDAFIIGRLPDGTYGGLQTKLIET
jgi:hypothetical protein